MKDLSMLVWLTQLGLSTAFPLAGFVLVGLWLHNSRGWGAWTVWAGLVIGLICAITGFRDCLRAMEHIARSRDRKDDPPVSFNEHQ